MRVSSWRVGGGHRGELPIPIVREEAPEELRGVNPPGRELRIRALASSGRLKEITDESSRRSGEVVRGGARPPQPRFPRTQSPRCRRDPRAKAETSTPHVSSVVPERHRAQQPEASPHVPRTPPPLEAQNPPSAPGIPTSGSSPATSRETSLETSPGGVKKTKAEPQPHRPSGAQRD